MGSLISRWSPHQSLRRAAGMSELQEGRGTAGTRKPPAPGTRVSNELSVKVNLINTTVRLKYESDLHHHLLGDIYRDGVMSQSSHRGA